MKAFADVNATSEKEAGAALSPEFEKATVVETTPSSIEFIDGAQEIRGATSALRLVVRTFSF